MGPRRLRLILMTGGLLGVLSSGCGSRKNAGLEEQAPTNQQTTGSDYGAADDAGSADYGADYSGSGYGSTDYGAPADGAASPSTDTATDPSGDELANDPNALGEPADGGGVLSSLNQPSGLMDALGRSQEQAVDPAAGADAGGTNADGGQVLGNIADLDPTTLGVDPGAAAGQTAADPAAAGLGSVAGMLQSAGNGGGGAGGGMAMFSQLLPLMTQMGGAP